MMKLPGNQCTPYPARYLDGFGLPSRAPPISVSGMWLVIDHFTGMVGNSPIGGSFVYGSDRDAHPADLVTSSRDREL